MTRPRTSDVRREPPLSVKLAVALRMLREAGVIEEGPVHYDHDPALGLRAWDETAGDFIPPQHDPAYLVIRNVEPHKVKTGGTRATSYGSDAHAIAKIDRVASDHEEFRRRLLTKQTGEDPPPPKKRSYQWPKRRLRSGGGFNRRHP